MIVLDLAIVPILISIIIGMLMSIILNVLILVCVIGVLGVTALQRPPPVQARA